MNQNTHAPRELTYPERTAIRKLVVSMCANFDSSYGCLPLDCECCMLGKWWTGALCKYFREAVLPLNPALETALTDNKPMTILHCSLCGKVIPSMSNSKKYGGACAKCVQRKQKAEYARKKRRDSRKVES